MKDPHQKDSSHHQEDRHLQPHCWISFLTKVRYLSLPLCRRSEKHKAWKICTRSQHCVNLLSSLLRHKFLRKEGFVWFVGGSGTVRSGRVALGDCWSPCIWDQDRQTDMHPMLTWFPCSFLNFSGNNFTDTFGDVSPRLFQIQSCWQQRADHWPNSPSSVALAEFQRR